MNVLFVGNSYTAPVHQAFRGLAAANGKAGRFDAAVINGATLRGHLDAADAARAIAQGGWGVVVLQEQSQVPGLADDTIRRVMDPALAELRKLCQDRGATPLLFCHWARREGDRENDPADTYERQRERLRATFLRLGREQGLGLVPILDAWDDVLSSHRDLALH